MVKITVIGSGVMGVKIAGDFALHGHRVKLYDSNLQSLNSAFERIEEDKNELRSEGLMAQRNFLGQILCLSRLEEAVSDTDFIFEAVTEDLNVKQDLFESIVEHSKPEAIIASNTMLLDLDEVVMRARNKERTLGLRFLYPVYFIPEVEITPGKDTSAQTIEKVRHVLERMGKTLFFRSGGEPLVLSEEQREARKLARLEQIKNQSGFSFFFENAVPQLSHRGSLVPNETDLSPSEGADCAICMNKPRDSLLCPCHHMVTCNDCAAMLIGRRDCCPICRKEITQLIKVYQA